MFFGDVCVETMRYTVKVVLADTAYKTVGLHIVYHTLQLVTQFTEGVNNQT